MMIDETLSAEALRRRLENQLQMELALRAEVSGLARSLRRARALGVVVALLILVVPAVFLSGAVRVERVATRRFDLVDEKGRVRMGLVASGASASLRVLDVQGREQITLSADDEKSLITLRDPSTGEDALTLAATELGVELTLLDKGRTLRLMSRESGAKLSMGNDDDQTELDAATGSLTIGIGHSRARLDPTRLELRASDENRAALTVEKDGTKLVMDHQDSGPHMPPPGHVSLEVGAEAVSLAMSMGDKRRAELSDGRVRIQRGDDSLEVDAQGATSTRAGVSHPARCTQVLR